MNGALQRSLPRAAYWDEAFYAREQSSIFWNEWFLVARADALSAHGAFRVVDVAGESIVVLRDNEGTLRAHLNFCRHRGSRLLCGEVTLRGAIRCPYHAWAYALDGTLAATPLLTKTCLYTLTPDRDFVIDMLPDHPHVCVAVGAGHAFKFASLIGRILSELALDGRTQSDITSFEVNRPILKMTSAPKSYMV